MPRRSNVQRASGRTSRTLWRALLYASENNDSAVVIFVANGPLADWTFQRLCDFAAPVGFTRLPGRRRLRMPSAATIEVAITPRTMEDEMRWRGIERLHTINDHSIR